MLRQTNGDADVQVNRGEPNFVFRQIRVSGATLYRRARGAIHA
jgi:hypothetical protein